MIVLALLAIGIIVVAYFVPAAVEEYAKKAAVVEPTNLSLESLTADGVRARIRANFRLDGSRVQNDGVRNIGRAATWLVSAIGTADETEVRVFLPDYGDALLGTARLPPLAVSLRDGETTAVDVVAHLIPGDTAAFRSVVNSWLDGKLDFVRLRGNTALSLKTGFIPLGTHDISEVLAFEGQSFYRSFASLYFGEKSLF